MKTLFLGTLWVWFLALGIMAAVWYLWFASNILRTLGRGLWKLLSR